MSFRIVEGDLRFDFDDRWTPITHWDRHPAYRVGKQGVKGLKAVDVVGIFEQDTLLLMEMKDYRNHPREKVEDVATEFEQKVRSSVASLVGARRSGRYPNDCDRFGAALLAASTLKLVLWVEDPPQHGTLSTVAERRSRSNAGTLTSKLQQHLRWLSANRVIPCNLKTYRDLLPGLEVTPLSPHRRMKAEQLVDALRIRFPHRVRDEDAWCIYDSLDEAQLDEWLADVPNVRSVRELLRR